MAFCGGSEQLGDGSGYGDHGNTLILHLRLDSPGRVERFALNRRGYRKVDTVRTNRINDFCSRVSPTWEIGDGGVFLDLQGMQRLHGSWGQGAAAICIRAQAEFPVWSAGLASSQLASRLASLVGSQGGDHRLFAVPQRAVPSFLSGFSIRVLNRSFHEVARLRSLGIHTLGDLQVLPENLLVAVFGANGSRLSKEAWGVHSGVRPGAYQEPGSQLVAQVLFATPLVSMVGEKALRRALALRALSKGVGVGRWSLSVRWSSGAKAAVWLPGPGSGSWVAWLTLMDGLWDKLPAHRQGIRQLDLFFQDRDGDRAQQMDLFEKPGGPVGLSRVIAQIRQKSDPSFAPASEALLAQWGPFWVTDSEKKDKV